MNSALRDLIRLLAEIVADELLAEQCGRAGIPTIQQAPDALIVREGNPDVHQIPEKSLLPAHP
jgi:hypothetical protein